MAKTVCAILITGALALAVVWQGAEMRATGYEAQELQERIEAQAHRRQKYQAHLSKLKNPRRITRLIAWLGLELEQPGPQVRIERTIAATPDRREATELSDARTSY